MLMIMRIITLHYCDYFDGHNVIGYFLYKNYNIT